MYYLAYYQGKNHVDINHFDSLAKIAGHVKSYTSCTWVDNFAIFADQWDTDKAVGIVRSDGSILWTGSTNKATEAACKFLNKLTS